MHAVSRPEWRKEGNGYLLSKSRFMFMAAFRDKFNDKVVAEMRGVIDEHGYSPFWQSLGKRFFSMDFSRADFLCGTGQKAFIAELMPKHPIYTHFLSQEAQDVIGQVHPQTAPARAVLEKEGFRYRNYIDIFDGGPTLECDIDRVRAIRKVGWWKWPKGSLRRAIFRPAWSPMKIITISAWCWCVPIQRPSV